MPNRTENNSSELLFKVSRPKWTKIGAISGVPEEDCLKSKHITKVGFAGDIPWCNVGLMSPIDAAINGLEQAVAFYVKDLSIMTEDQILQPVSGSARAAVDFTYEVAFINLGMAARLRGEEPAPSSDDEEWMTAPAELRSKDAMINYFQESGKQIVAAAKAIPAEDGGRLVGTPGRERPAFAYVNFAAMHTMYHDAQLNFIQSIYGDCKMHWF